MNLRPELLQLSQIPKPLHGVNPREIMGKQWWDETRHEIFYHQNFRCAACGVHKNDARYHKWLECHEVYEINYLTGEVKFVELVGLCPSCHKFIHSGFSKAMYEKSIYSKEMFEDIMNHGFKILKENNLEPHPVSIMEWLFYKQNLSNKELWNSMTDNQRVILSQMLEDNAKVKWSDWHLVFEGKKYYSKFKDELEWKNFYRR